MAREKRAIHWKPRLYRRLIAHNCQNPNEKWSAENFRLLIQTFLNSILVSQDVTAVGDDTILALPPLKLLVKGGSGVKPASINMAAIREIAEAFVRQLAILDQGEQRRDQQYGKSQTFGVIKKSLANIKVQWGYQEAEARQVTKSLVEDLSIALSTTELGEAEEKRLITIIDESAKRLDVLFNSSKVVDKSITQLLQKIDDAAS